jgi:adenosylcobinamide kinase/adenosylcobinamide-phosphate guanylyltransferase
MIVFISGGAKNGKSTIAQDLTVQLSVGGTHYYVATMIPADEEDNERIRRHIEDRDGMGFETIEVGRNILSCLEKADCGGAFMLDSVTALLLNELFPNPLSPEMDVESAHTCGNDVVTFAQSVKNAVIVSDFIYSDAARYDEVTETYRKCLADIDRKLAAVSDVVIEVAAGNMILHKGELPG